MVYVPQPVDFPFLTFECSQDREGGQMEGGSKEQSGGQMGSGNKEQSGGQQSDG